MSDLQCAATAVVVPAGGLWQADRLRAERPAAVLAAPGAVEAAVDLARVLDVEGHDLSDAASPSSLVRALDDVADEFRGECLAVVLTATAFADLLRLVLPGGEAVAVVVEIDADGQRWAPWPREVSAARGR